MIFHEPRLEEKYCAVLGTTKPNSQILEFSPKLQERARSSTFLESEVRKSEFVLIGGKFIVVWPANVRFHKGVVGSLVSGSKIKITVLSLLIN